MKICKACGKECKDTANFCGKCAAKLSEVCNCWIKRKPYNCHQEVCPGYRLWIIEANQDQASS